MTSTEESWKSWLCDLEPEDYSFINSVEGCFPSPQEHNLLGSFSSLSHSSSTMSNSSGDVNSFERPSKTLNTFPSSNGCISLHKDSYFLSFNNENPEPMLNNDSTLKPKGNNVVNQKKESKRNIHESKKTDSLTRSPNHNLDHIIAERKRRENISQQFIALSALIPGLKKVDKASVLGDAIKHVKQLQEKVKLLEEKNQRKIIESVVLYVEKSKSSSDNDVSETSSNSCDHSKTNRSMPEVEARVLEKNVMIRIHCEKHKGVLMNIIKEIENLHLSVTNSSTLLFGTSKLDITIIAKMEEEYSLSVQELAKSIQVALLQFM